MHPFPKPQKEEKKTAMALPLQAMISFVVKCTIFPISLKHAFLIFGFYGSDGLYGSYGFYRSAGCTDWG